MARVTVKLSEQDIRHALSDWIYRRYNVAISPGELHIEVKSKQNYKSEWEIADIRLEIEVTPTPE